MPVTGSFKRAGIDPVDPPIYLSDWQFEPVSSVWYSWSPDHVGAALVSIFNSDVFTQLDVFLDVDGAPVAAWSIARTSSSQECAFSTVQRLGQSEAAPFAPTSCVVLPRASPNQIFAIRVTSVASESGEYGGSLTQWDSRITGTGIGSFMITVQVPVLLFWARWGVFFGNRGLVQLGRERVGACRSWGSGSSQLEVVRCYCLLSLRP